MEAFLSACASNNREYLESLVSSPSLRELTYAVDSEGRNGLHLAVLNGHWSLAMFLVRILKVSPHKLTSHNESIYHSIVRGTALRPPTASDFNEVREINAKALESRRKQRAIQLESGKKQSGLDPPRHLLIKEPANELEKQFGTPRLTFAKYILTKYQVVLTQPNSEGILPSELAQELGQPDLAELFTVESTPEALRRRLMSTLNEQMFRKVIKFR